MEDLSKNRKAIRCILLGCGNIGSKWDEDHLKDSPDVVRTHLKAMLNTDGLEVVGIYDVDKNRAMEAARFWGNLSVIENLETFNFQNIDLAVLATPSINRLGLVKFLQSKGVRTFFLEKPLENNIESAEEILNLVDSGAIKCAVNFSRTFNSEFLKLSYEIQNGVYGEFKSGSVYYGKGFSNNGSHAISTIAFLLEGVEKLTKGEIFLDAFKHDPTIHFKLKVKDKDVFVIASDFEDYSIMEYDLFFSNARIKIINSGRQIEISKVKTDPNYSAYKILELAEVRHANLNTVLLESYAEIKLAMELKSDLFDSNLELTKKVHKLYKESK